MKGIPREVVASVKRTITNSREIRELREKLTLTDYQRSVLVGSVLGDAGLYAGGWAKNHRLVMEQGEKQKEYLFWKFEVFRNCCFTPPSYQIKNHSWKIRTISHAAFNQYADEFYHERKKIVPYRLLDSINALSLAVWFMDDGTKGPPKGYTINTQSFSYADNRYLKEFLEEKFSLKISLHKDRKWWRLFVNPASAEAFKAIISPYVIPSMRYKLYAIDPVETTRRPPIVSIGVKI